MLVRPGPGSVRLGLGDQEVVAAGRLSPDGTLEASLDGQAFGARLRWHGAELELEMAGAHHRLRLYDPLAAASDREAGSNRLIAPMPGKVVQVHVAPGDRVGRGDALMVLEAMKMEHTIVASMDGRVGAVHYGPGDLVEEGADLADLESD